MQKIIIVSGPVIVEDGKVLLNQHGDTTFWKFCGGRVEDYEHTLIEHAKREVKEEMGIDIEILDLNPFITYTQKQTPDEMIDVILVHYIAKRIGEIRPHAEIRELKWFPLDQLPTNLAPNIIPVLRHFGFNV